MNKLIVSIIIVVALCLLVACGNGVIHTDDITSEIVDEYRWYSENDYSKYYSEESYPQRVVWEDYAEYVSGIPKPSFVIGKPLEVQIAGVDMLTFSAAEGTTIDQLKEYITSLELAGFENSITKNTQDYFSGTVYNGATTMLEYTYRYGIIKIDVFKAIN